MDKLVYTALGAIVNQTAQRVQLTNDLANVSTVGYKRSISARPETVSYKLTMAVWLSPVEAMYARPRLVC